MVKTYRLFVILFSLSLVAISCKFLGLSGLQVVVYPQVTPSPPMAMAQPCKPPEGSERIGTLFDEPDPAQRVVLDFLEAALRGESAAAMGYWDPTRPEFPYAEEIVRTWAGDTTTFVLGDSSYGPVYPGADLPLGPYDPRVWEAHVDACIDGLSGFFELYKIDDRWEIIAYGISL